MGRGVTVFEHKKGCFSQLKQPGHYFSKTVLLKPGINPQR